ncbi:DMT family transporter [Pontivivens insulae]|uniref:Riboflavin transporter n=1 Tax=Pontivivens insulae TaxID=1639689 RepID=A0A2R8AAN8_9RHOB|nr:DMT family transporter [Pontivivens insulae]RED13177.1 EamA-like transporter family protein [Pontivivens insulae]SPF29269.1 Riboflavin transporter [Pontivivens insulae]
MQGSAYLKAVAWMLLATCSFTAMAVAGREIAAELDTFELMLYRSLIGIGIVVAVSAAVGQLGTIRAHRMGLHAFRNIGHFSGQNLWFFAVASIPLAQVVALEFTTPLWVAIAAALFLGERLTRYRMFAVLLGFIGVLIVARPDGLDLSPGVVAAALCAIGFAISFIATKKLSQTESTASILFWLTVMQALFSLICAGWDLSIAVPSLAMAPYVLLVSITGLLAHFCITQALRCAPASVVAPLDFARLPLVAVVGWALYAEPFALAILGGGALIVVANVMNIRAMAQGR